MEEIRKRLESTTDQGAWGVPEGFDGEVWVACGAWPYGKNIAECFTAEDANFIAHAPSDIAYLLAELAELEQKLADVNDDYMRRHNDAVNAFEENIRLNALLQSAQAEEREAWKDDLAYAHGMRAVLTAVWPHVGESDRELAATMKRLDAMEEQRSRYAIRARATKE